MNQQPDKLFRDKLHGFEKPVSNNAWNRISDNLDKKNNRFTWLKMAAALLLLATAGILVFSLEPRNNAPVVTEKVEPAKKMEPTQDSVQVNKPFSAPGMATTTPPSSTPKEKHARVKEPGKNKTSSMEKSTPGVGKAYAMKQSEPLTQQEFVEEGNSVISEIIAPAISDIIVPAAKAEENVNLVFKVEEVNEKYLRKKYTVAEATPEEKEPSALRKLLDKAYELKHNQDPLGELRQRKNEILALNFKNGKGRNENK